MPALTMPALTVPALRAWIARSDLAATGGLTAITDRAPKPDLMHAEAGSGVVDAVSSSSTTAPLVWSSRGRSADHA